jgi:hypothetical protein
MDFDPRDYDDDLRLPDVQVRDHDDDTRDLGRGPGDDARQPKDEDLSSDPRDDSRWPDRDTPDREVDPREVFTRGLTLPREMEREIVHCRDREYTLRGSESRSLATVSAFRVVSSRDLRDYNGRSVDPRSGDLRHLRTRARRDASHSGHARPRGCADEGRSERLESHRDRDRDGRQTFYAGLKRERELEHDVQVYAPT